MSRIVVSEYLPDHFLTRVGEDHDVVYDPDLYADRPRLLRETADAVAVIIRNRTRVDRPFLESARSLRVVGRLGVGLDNIDMTACSAQGVTVIPAVGANAVSVAEYVIAAMLILVRGVFGMTESMIAGGWPRQGHAFGRELMGKTLGLLGLGSIGLEVATRARSFGMDVIAHDPFLGEDDPRWERNESVALGDLLPRADVVSIHVPLTEDTANLFTAHRLASMKPGAILINTARGGIVDEIALADSLRSGRLGGAAIDVFATEPLGLDGGRVFAGLENLILTPHIAGNTRESVDRVATMTVESVLAALA